MEAIAVWNPKTSCLILDWTPVLGFDCRQTLTGWDRGLQVTASSDGEEDGVSLGSIGDWLLTVSDTAVNHWRSLIPTEILEEVSKLPNLQARALECIARDPAARDLLANNPMLFWLCLDQGGDALPDYRQKQRSLVDGLGLCGTRQRVRILQKAAQQPFSAKQAKNLMGLLTHPNICLFLSHSHVITEPMIDTLVRYPWLADCPAKAVIPHLDHRANRQFFADVINMQEDLGLVRRCPSWEAVISLHDRLVDALNTASSTNRYIRDAEGNVRDLPLPPRAANEHIYPLTTQHEIFKEGRRQRHCIGSYVGRVLQGYYYVYVMTEPERLTIGLKIDRRGMCSIAEVRGPRNRAPSEQSMKQISAWLSEKKPASNQHIAVFID